MRFPTAAAATSRSRWQLPNRPTPAPGFYTEIEIDADFNSATGEPVPASPVASKYIAVKAVGVREADYYLAANAEGYGLGRWNSAAWEPVPAPASLIGSYSGGMVFTINASDLGGTTEFLFWVGVTEDPAATVFSDVAPEAGLFPYVVLEPAPVAVRIVPPKAGLVPRGGKVFSAQGIKVELDNGELVAPDERTCVLKIAGKVAKPMAGGCKWRIPAIAAGKRGVLSVTVTHGDVTLTEKYPLKVAR